MKQYWILISVIILFFGWYLYEHFIRNKQSTAEGVTFSSSGPSKPNVLSVSNQQKAQLLQVTNSSISKSTNIITIVGTGPPKSPIDVYYANPSTSITNLQPVATAVTNDNGNFTVNVPPKYISLSKNKPKIPLSLTIVATIPTKSPPTEKRSQKVLSNVPSPNVIQTNYVVSAQ